MATTFNQQVREHIPHGLKTKSYKVSFIALLIMNAKYVFWGLCVPSVPSLVTCDMLRGLNELSEAEGGTGADEGLKQVAHCRVGAFEGEAPGLDSQFCSYLVFCKDIPRL